MIRASASALLFLAAACAPEPSAAALPADFAALVPADAVALVQLRSASEFAEEFEAVRVLIAPDEPPVRAREVLTDALADLLHPAPVDYPGLDTSRPAGLALSLGASVMQPVVTFILPTTKPAAFAALFAHGQKDVSATTSGNYVAVRMGPGLAPVGETSPLLQDFPPGLMSARADLASLLASYRPLIDIGLVAMEAEMRADMEVDPEIPIDPTAMVDWYVGIVRAALDSAERLDLALDLGESRVGLVMSLRSKEGSPMAQLSRNERVDYAALAGRLDPQAAALVIACYSQAELMGKFADAFDSFAQALQSQQELPPEMAAAMAAYLQAMQEIVPRMGREMALSYDLGAGGLRMAADIGAPDPADLARRMTAFLRGPAPASLGFGAGPETRGELGGHPAILWKQTIDKEHLAQLAQVEELGGPDIIDLLFGQDGLEMALLPGPDRLGMLTGGDAAWREQAARRVMDGGAADPALLRALEPIAGANPAMFMQVDFRPFMPFLTGFPAVSDGPPLRFNLYWGLDGRDLVAGLGTDLESIRGMAELAD